MKIPQSYNNLFENIYFACKQELSILTAISLHEFTQYKLGVPIPEYHTSFKSATKIIKAISDVIRKNILEDIKRSENIGILIDESKDIADKEILLLYIRYHSKKEKNTKELFFSLFELEEQTSKTIYQKLKDFLVKEGIFERVRFLCTDGANAMSSEKEGVAGLLMKDLPQAKTFKCICHQESLALKHTYKEFNALQDFNADLYNIIAYFARSPKKIVILDNVQQELDYETTYRLIKAKEIRWNSFFYATNRVRELYPALIKALKQITIGSFKKLDQDKALELIEKMCNFNFVLMLNWLSDFLGPICFLNKLLQAPSYKLGNLQTHINSTLSFFENSYINVEKPNLVNPDNAHMERSTDEIMKYHLKFCGFHLNNLIENCQFENDGKVQFNLKEDKKIELKFKKVQAFSLKFLIVDAAKYLHKELQSMIPNDNSIFKSFEVFNFDKWQKLKGNELQEFGNQEIWTLSQHYFAENSTYLLDRDFVLVEWSNFKLRLLDDFEKKLFEDDFINHVLESSYFKDGFTIIIQLLTLYSTLPVSNAEVERGFSALSRIKTKLRNKLSVGRLEDLMMISLNGPNIKDWQVKESFFLWETHNKIRNLNVGNDT